MKQMKKEEASGVARVWDRITAIKYELEQLKP